MAILAFKYPVFQPSMRIISAITNSNPAQVTTTFPHQYLTGTIVRLDIPPLFGMPQANQAFGNIFVTSTTTFDVDIDTTLMDPYTPSTKFPFSQQYGQVVPFAEENHTLRAAVQNVLPYPLPRR